MLKRMRCVSFFYTHLCALVLGCLLSFSPLALAQPSPFMAQSSDSTLSGLVQRWAQHEGRNLLWEVPYDYPLLDAEALNQVAHLQSATTLTEAFTRLTHAMMLLIQPEQAPLVACVFSDTLLVKPLVPNASPCQSPKAGKLSFAAPSTSTSFQ